MMEKILNKILYIDDEDSNLILFDAVFSKYFDITLASSTREAEKLMEEIQFKVIVSDINMPSETGLKFFNRIPKTENTPILIILTAYVSNNLILEAFNQGRIFRYITKPWKLDDLKTSIDQAIQLFDLEYENHQLYLQIIESQKNFYNIFQSSQDGIVILDESELILEANPAFENMLKISNTIVTGKKLIDLVPPDIQKKITNGFSQLFQNATSRIEFEYYSKTDGNKIVELNCSVIEYKGTKAVLIFFRDITERKYNELKLLNAVVLAEEQERSRLAKDLHDGLGPLMSTLKMYLEWLNNQDQISKHPDILELSLKSINESITTLKRISNNLSPHILEKFGLIAALNKFIDSIKKVSHINFSLMIDKYDRFDLTTEMSLYRIITECINNTIRHSEAFAVDICLQKSDHILFFSYKDNGKGFSSSEAGKYENGLGLLNINNRIKTLGGKVTIQSSPGKGFLLESEIPII